MTMITTQHKNESCTLSGTYTLCTYILKGGNENQLAFEFPLSTVYTYTQISTWF